MPVVCALLRFLSIAGRIVIFLALVVGLLVVWPLVYAVVSIDSLTTRLRNSSKRSARPAGLPHGSCDSLSDDFIASIVTSHDSSERDHRK